LIVPKIFFEARWPNRTTVVDVLAIDRSGAGDLHAVEIVPVASRIESSLAMLSRVPAHFKYLAYSASQMKMKLCASLIRHESLMKASTLLTAWEG
jgi:hypothetical protein